jgi:hypothetical protein
MILASSVLIGAVGCRVRPCVCARVSVRALWTWKRSSPMRRRCSLRSSKSRLDYASRATILFGSFVRWSVATACPTRASAQRCGSPPLSLQC